MADIYGGEIFVETWGRLVFTDTLLVKNFAEITLSCMVFEIQAFLCFAIFCEKFGNSKMAKISDKSFLKNGSATQQIYPMGDKIALFSRYTHFLCFAIFAKNSKIQNGHHF